MPGAGKSTIGVVLAKVLGYQFLDSDLLIQKQERRRLREIIEEEGIDSLSIRKTAEKAGYNSATLYHYFSDFEELRIWQVTREITKENCHENLHKNR